MFLYIAHGTYLFRKEVERMAANLAEEIKEARSHGDLSENSEYDEAKNTQGLVENRITELEQMQKFVRSFLYWLLKDF